MELVTRTITQRERDHAPIIVAPIGDIQWAGQRGPTALDTLKRHIDLCLEREAWYVGLGDYIDFLSPSNRQRVKSAALSDTANDVIDDAALHLVYELYDTVLKPTTGRWLGLVHGHHWAQLQTGETTDQRLCQLLQAKFLGTSAFIRLLFKNPNSETRCPLTIFVHHGCGGGMKASAPLNRLENILPYWDADIFLIGHMTKQAVAPINRISPRWAGNNAPDLVHRKIYLVGCGGFAKGYDKGASLGNVPMGGYVEQSLMNPASLGAPLIKIVPRRDYTIAGGGASSRRGVWAPDVTVEI